MKEPFHNEEELNISREFLLSPEAESIRRVADSLYPNYLRNKERKGQELNPQALSVLDEKFMTSPEGRWARILAEVSYAEYVMKKNHIDHTVVFFGSARIKEPDTPGLSDGENKQTRYYADCRELGRRLTEWSLGLHPQTERQPFMVVTGGGPAIMEAGNRGAKDAGGRSIGLNITLPMEQYPNPYITEDLSFDFHYFFTRKFHFSYRAKAVVAFPGGYGTMDELFELLTLVQTGKIRKDMKILVYGKDFWNAIFNFEALADTGVISREDLDLFEMVDDVDTAEKILKEHLAKFHRGGKS